MSEDRGQHTTPVFGFDPRRADFTRPDIIRSAFIQLFEFHTELVRTNVERQQLLKRGFEQITDRDAHIMGALVRLENQALTTRATCEAHLHRLQRLEAHLSSPAHHDPMAVAALAREVETIKGRIASGDKREAVARAKLEAKASELQRRLDETKEDLTATGQHYVQETLRRAHELEAEMKAKDAAQRASIADGAKEAREDKRWWVRWVAGLVGAVMLVVVGAWAGARWAKPASVPALPAAGAR